MNLLICLLLYDEIFFKLIILVADVLSRLKNMLSISSKMCLHKCNSYVMSYFTYCSVIWHNCNESDKQKLERHNVRALACVYNKRVPLHGDDDYGLTLSNRRLQNIAILIFKL